MVAMDGKSIHLHLTSEVRATLVALLTATLTMEAEAQVVDHLASNPWGDLEAFRRSVYFPLVEGRVEESGLDRIDIEIEATNVPPIRDVMTGLAESFSGGVPWVALSEAERAAVEKLLAQLARQGHGA